MSTAGMHLEIIAKWLHRRYAVKVPRDRASPWELLGGKLKGPWYGDAQGILDAIEKNGQEHDG